MRAITAFLLVALLTVLGVRPAKAEQDPFDKLFQGGSEQDQKPWIQKQLEPITSLPDKAVNGAKDFFGMSPSGQSESQPPVLPSPPSKPTAEEPKDPNLERPLNTQEQNIRNRTPEGVRRVCMAMPGSQRQSCINRYWEISPIRDAWKQWDTKEPPNQDAAEDFVCKHAPDPESCRQYYGYSVPEWAKTRHEPDGYYTDYAKLQADNEIRAFIQEQEKQETRASAKAKGYDRILEESLEYRRLEREAAVKADQERHKNDPKLPPLPPDSFMPYLPPYLPAQPKYVPPPPSATYPGTQQAPPMYSGNAPQQTPPSTGNRIQPTQPWTGNSSTNQSSGSKSYNSGSYNAPCRPTCAR